MNSEPKTYNILVVEDNQKMSDFLKTSLEARNHRVDIINNGTRALKTLEKLQRNSYDIVLLDIMLPGASGWEILAKIRSLPNTLDYPVIMLTGMDDEACETMALYDGADDFITKPFTIKVLLARIEANIRKKTSFSIIDFDISFTDSNFKELTSREKEILGYIVKGLSNREIAQETFITEGTVMNHVKKILEKLGVSSRIQAAIVALKYKLI